MELVDKPETVLSSSFQGMPMHPQFRRPQSSESGSDNAGEGNEQRTSDMLPFDPRMWPSDGRPPYGHPQGNCQYIYACPLVGHY